MSEKTDITKVLGEMAEAFQEAEKSYRDDAEKFWQSLSEEQRLMAFFSVVDRMYKAEVQERGTYRYALYDVYGFGMESYGIGMNCGYMEIHNLIYEALENANNKK